MGIQCLLFGLRSSRTFISAYRLTCIQSSRALVSTATQSVKVNDITSILKPLTLRCLRVNSVRNAYTFTSTAVAKDVILFEHDRTRFFRLLAIFCGGQFLFWAYLAHFAFTSLRDTRKNSGEPQKVRTELGGLFSFDMNLGSNAWRYGFTLGCLIIGGGIVGLAVLFSRRSVSRVILHKGGGKVTVSTQSPLGPLRAHHLTVPLTQVTCHAHRQESPSFIPLKIKGYKFYFLLDKEGTLNNPKLFDITVGAYRPL
ncbi:transmembrane protein 223 [Sinocyclocheilus anshuiensis]|uniref:Transmembrane protein 223-like n=1 Tax=Sinocyclocheilus anshuiensis TaxID=1608454 RepID=A0A671QPL6_9TELE|nr:PREDICTED: transmembrane protein 223-like [Sinocyclocheilus anshuiensis]